MPPGISGGGTFVRALVQRVTHAGVRIDGKEFSSVQKGLVVLLGVRKGDSPQDAAYLAEKCCSLRVFEDENQKMNLSLEDIGGSILAVSQFTLYADTRKGNRPSFMDASPPEESEPLYEKFLECLRARLGGSRVAAGVFRAMMKVELENDGPVTIMLESKG